MRWIRNHSPNGEWKQKFAYIPRHLTIGDYKTLWFWWERYQEIYTGGNSWKRKLNDGTEGWVIVGCE